MSGTANDDTLLVLTELGIPLYAARGLTQTLEPIQAAANLRRTVNGSLIDLSYSQFRKYASTISCTDQRVPALDGVWPGQELTVSCVAELAYADGASPQRESVSGSERQEDGFTFYRPILTMLVTRFHQQIDEWGAAVGWELDLEEI